MSKSNPNAITTAVFELGRLFVVLRFRAEAHWLDDDEDLDRRGSATDLRHLGVAASSLKAAAREVATETRPHLAIEHVDAFVASVDEFWSHFRAAWRGDRRAKQLKSIAGIDPEQQDARDRFMHEGSPMSDGHWDRVQPALDRFLQAIDRNLQACFALSVLLTAELYPTFTAGQRGRDADAELAYLRVDYVKDVNQAVQSLVEDFPFLARVELDLAGETVSGAMKRIDRCWRGIRDLLKDPLSAPGHLGLVLDRRGCRIGRDDRWQTLSSPKRWNVLVILERSGTEFASRDLLEAAWRDDPASLWALDRALTDLRKVLKPLGVRVRLMRNVGWRLEEISSASPSDS